MHRVFLGIGFSFASLAIGADALATHALAERLTPARLEWFQLAARYQLLHAFALVVLGLVAARWPLRAWNVSGIMIILGVFVFSGGLYLRALTDQAMFGAVTPIGGLLFIGAWAWAGWVAFTRT